ncbi:MAG: tetratricopeptide repeat protein [Prevotellaceae bacterium]|nr:tetratricopeptide repeat protein [Prevotellaceae bacterium]
MKKLFNITLLLSLLLAPLSANAQATVENIYEIALMQYQNHNYTKAVENFQKAAASGHVKAIYSLGCCFQDGTGVIKDEAMALQMFTEAANAGYDKAQSTLGDAYAWKRLGIKKKDYQEAVRWYALAGQQGNANALYQLGRCYEAGRGVKKDKKMAAAYYQKAVEAGNPYASEYLNKILSKHPEYAY